MNIVLLIASILGFVSVAFGAYNEHGLKKKISEDVYRNVIVSVRYNQIYSALLAAIGLAFYADLPQSLESGLFWVSMIFTFAVLLFCFSIYLYAVLNKPKFARLAPIGGISFMIGWLVLGWVAITSAA
ncbi:MAG: DUF423 domain-containing protein [Pseudomonadota bacterium]